MRFGLIGGSNRTSPVPYCLGISPLKFTMTDQVPARFNQVQMSQLLQVGEMRKKGARNKDSAAPLLLERYTHGPAYDTNANRYVRLACAMMVLRASRYFIVTVRLSYPLIGCKPFSSRFGFKTTAAAAAAMA